MNVSGDIRGILQENVVVNASVVIKGKDTLIFITEHIKHLTTAKCVEIMEI
jgi:hypothetical protein